MGVGRGWWIRQLLREGGEVVASGLLGSSNVIVGSNGGCWPKVNKKIIIKITIKIEIKQKIKDQNQSD